MYVLVTYDVATSTEGGIRRLRQVATTCLDYGQRVQNSVFECQIDPGQLATFKARLEEIMEPEHDSIRFYYLGKNWHRRVEHLGAKPTYDVDGFLGI